MVPFKNAVSFGSWERKGIGVGVKLHRSTQGQLAIASVVNVVQPNKFSETKEGVEA